MEAHDTALSDAERYAVWCEQTRALFAVAERASFGEEEKSGHLDEDRTSASADNGAGDGDDTWGKQSRNDDGEFPFCFYLRMLSCGKRGEKTCEMSDVNCSDSHFSSVLDQRTPLRIDNDALAARLTSKLNTYARTLRRNLPEETPLAVKGDNTGWVFRDGSVEVVAAKVNEELHEMLMHVRRHNMLSEQLRRQLVQTKQLLREKKSGDVMT